MFYYIVPESLGEIFSLIREAFTSHEQVPVYEDEQEGLKKLTGVLEMTQASEYYPDLLDKATHLFVGINKGHFFSNGNKRLALVCATVFLAANDHELSTVHSKEQHRQKLHELFPGFGEIEDDPKYFPEEYGLYNLSIIVAESHTYTDGNFDALKGAVRAYLDFATNPPNSGRLKEHLPRHP